MEGYLIVVNEREGGGIEGGGVHRGGETKDQFLYFQIQVKRFQLDIAWSRENVIVFLKSLNDIQKSNVTVIVTGQDIYLLQRY